MKFLIASPFLPYPDTNGAKARIMTVIRMLAKAGHEVHLAYLGLDKADRDRCRSAMEGRCASFTDLRDEAYPWAEPSQDGYSIDDWVSSTQCEDFQNLHRRLAPDVTIVNYIFLSKLIEGLDSVTVIDLHDRLARADQYEAINQPPKFFFTTETLELQALKRADIALCIQENERRYFERAGVPLFTLGHILPRNYLDRRYSKLRTVGYLGAYNLFNINAIEELLPAFSRLAEKYPDLRLRLTGGICKAISTDLPFLEKIDYAPSLEGFYADIDVAVNPTLVGTGLKIKSVEALSYGVPLVATVKAMDGLPILTEHHSAADMTDVADALQTLKEREFKGLTQLANISRVVHTEYTETQQAMFRAFLHYCDQRRIEKMKGIRAASATTSTRKIEIADLRPPTMSQRMLHVLNPFHAPPTSDNFLAQQITFQSMSDAIDFARNHVKVDVLNLYMSNESPVRHALFSKVDVLDQSSKEILPDYPRKLPLLREVLSCAAKHDDYDWIIYTNVDIGLTPHFYRRLIEYVRDGHDAVVINRRTITKRISAVDQLGEAWAQIGEKHPGFDCFVFRRELIKKFEIFDTLIGVHLVGRMLMWNLLRHARSLHVEKNEHLTFHVGDDVPSKDITESAAIAHNFRQASLFWGAVSREHGERERIQQRAEEANVSDALRFNIGTLVTPRLHRPAAVPSPSCPVQLHGHYRCGSTFLFRSLRRDSGNMCFYEPLHEDIERFAPEVLEEKKKLHAPEKFHKEHDGEWFFKELESLVLREGHVPGFRAAFGTEFLGDNRPNREIESYVELLVNHAYEEGRRPILQFNRTGLRVEYFSRTFPAHAHFYMQRDLTDQWRSYLRFLRGGQRGFLRSMISSLSRGRDGDRIRPLAQLVPLYRIGTDRNLHSRYNPIFDLYTLEQLYVCFYYTWMVGILDSANCGVDILPMSRISSDPQLQAQLDEKLVRLGLAVDWNELKADGYNDSLLDEEVKKNCESVVNATLVKSYGPAVIDKLASIGQLDVAVSLAQNAQPHSETGMMLKAGASVEGVELHAKALAFAPQLREAEENSPAISRLVDQPQLLPALRPGMNRFSVKLGDFANVQSFGYGFSEPETSHIWVSQRHAGIAFRLQFPAARLQIRMFMGCTTELIEEKQKLHFSVNTQEVATRCCAEWGWVEFDVPRDVIAGGRNGSICISAMCSGAPERRIEQRQLYFAVSEIVIDCQPFQ